MEWKWKAGNELTRSIASFDWNAKYFFRRQKKKNEKRSNSLVDSCSLIFKYAREVAQNRNAMRFLHFAMITTFLCSAQGHTEKQLYVFFECLSSQIVNSCSLETCCLQHSQSIALCVTKKKKFWFFSISILLGHFRLCSGDSQNPILSIWIETSSDQSFDDCTNLHKLHLTSI